MILVLFDLQEILKEIEAGELTDNVYFSRYSNTTPEIGIKEAGTVKAIHISDKMALKPGIALNMSAIPNLHQGDRITITGRIGSGFPKTDWAMVIDRQTAKNGFSGLSQHITPDHVELFNVTYILEEIDLDKTFFIRTNFWGRGRTEDVVDFYVDSILITRNVKHFDTVIDDRQAIYSFATDENIKSMKPGDISRFIRSAGTPKYTMTERNGKRGVHLGRRMNNWDGVDIWLPNMNLKKGNKYTITVNGKIDGHATPGARVMLQMLPGYIWRSDMHVSDDQEFTLTHTLTAMELQISEAVRIATDENGATMSFFIHDIEITLNQ
ncbi:MAG: hypothetical protein LBI27_06455 [Clostridiales bacterium]|nr:hypothetical protein [Clostridiales bacterium]